MDRKRRLGIIGAGKLGMALAGYSGLKQHGLEVSALFDTDRAKWGAMNEQLTVFPFTELAVQRERLGLEIAVLTVPKAAAPRGSRRWRLRLVFCLLEFCAGSSGGTPGDYCAI